MATALIRVVVVDDHPVVREGTAALLAAQPGLTVTGTAGSLAEARALLARVEVDVVLLDIRLGHESGLGLLGATDAAPAGRPAIVVLTAYDYPQYAEAALRLGAAGFVLKTAPLGELVDAIRRAAGGGRAFQVRPPPAAAGPRGGRPAAPPRPGPPPGPPPPRGRPARGAGRRRG